MHHAAALHSAHSAAGESTAARVAAAGETAARVASATGVARRVAVALRAAAVVVAVLTHVVVATRSVVVMSVARFVADESADSGTNRDAETTGEGSQGKTGESADECATASAGISENFFSFADGSLSELSYFSAEPGTDRGTAADSK